MPYPKCSKCDKKIKHRKTRCQGGFLEIGRWLVTRAGFLSCTDIQPFEYFVDRFVDLKAKNWVNFTRFYSGKSVFTKVEQIRKLICAIHIFETERREQNSNLSTKDLRRITQKRVLFLDFLCCSTSSSWLGRLLKLSGGLIMGNSLTNDSPVFRCYNMRFNYEIYAFWFFNVSHLF
jgi:hypothetical protein